MALEENKRGPLLSLAGKVKLGLDPDASSYDRMPVENFGKMMLKKMGWRDEEGAGTDKKNALLHAIEYIPRHHRLGLGATPLPNMKINGPNSKEESIKPHEKSVLQSSNYKYVDEKLAVKAKIEIGAEVLINKGKHEGMYGRVVGLYGADAADGRSKEESVQLYIELLANDQTVKVSRDEVTIGKAGDSKETAKKQDTASSKHKSRSRSKSRSKSPSQSSGHSHNKKKHKLRWVVANIMVRVISKSYSGGKYYNKKVRVEDVPDRRSFTVATPEGMVLEDLRESDVETVIPGVAEDVMLVGGSHRGELGKLLMRDRKKDIVKVQMYDKDNTTVTCSQDDCCAVSEK